MNIYIHATHLLVGQFQHQHHRREGVRGASHQRRGAHHRYHLQLKKNKKLFKSKYSSGLVFSYALRSAHNRYHVQHTMIC